MPDMVDSLRRELRLISYGMIGAFLIMMVAVFLVSLYMSLNVAGPMFALRKRLKEFADGQSGLRLHLRTRDEFQTIEEIFNLAMENHDLRQRHLKENIDRVIQHLGNQEGEAARQVLKELKKDLPERTFLF
jgi:methyl-accepting chemotaxis protein